MAPVKLKFSQTQGLTSAAGEQILSQLNEHRDNLLPSEFAPHAAIGQKMKSMGKTCVQFQLAGKGHSEEMYIFPNMRGVIMSWKAAKALCILPSYYPQPPLARAPLTPSIDATTAMQISPTIIDLKKEFPTVC